MTIVNARDRKLGDASFIPDVSPGLSNILQSVKMTTVEKFSVDGYIREITRTFATKAAKMPLSPQRLSLKPEGQRAWRWFIILTLSNVSLKPDDAMMIGGLQYRVMAKEDWKEYGYYRYEVVEGFQSEYSGS